MAQPTFEKTFGTFDDDMGYSVSICNDGSYVVCGYSTNFDTGDEDIYTARINIFGDTIWTRRKGTAYNDDNAYSVKPTKDNGCIVTGFKSVSGEWAPFLLKYDALGNTEWYNDYSQYIPSGIGYSVLQNTDSGYVFCGISNYYDEKNMLWNRKAHLLRTNKMGEYLWDNTFGNNGIHYATDICFSGDDGFVISGEYDTPGEYTAAWLFKTNGNGSLNWNKTYGGNSSMESAWKVKKTNDGGYILCGTKFYGLIAMNGDIYVVKTDENGNEEWNKTYGTSEDERGSCIDITNDGGYIICGTINGPGSYNEDIWMIKINSLGDTLWTRTYGGIYEERAYDISETNDGGFIVCGYTRNIGNGGADIYLFKTNWLGTLTEISENTENTKSINIVPNPTDGIFSITNCPDICEFEIFDSNGKSLLFREKDPSGSAEFNIRKFPKGCYLLKLKSSQGIKSFKVIKK